MGVAIHLVAGLDPEAELRGVGDAQRNRARLQQAGDRGGIAVGHAVRGGPEPRGVGHPLHRDRLLDRARHAQQRRQHLVGCGGGDSGIGGIGGGARLVVPRGHNAMHARLGDREALNVRLNHLA